MEKLLKRLMIVLLTACSGQMFAQNNSSDNPLIEEVTELELHYVVWGCACPNWVTSTDFAQYGNNGLIDHCIYLEPQSDSLVLPDDFDPSADVLKVKGQYYRQKGYPKDFVITEEQEKPAMVFRVSEYTVEKGKQEQGPGLTFSFKATETDSGVQVRCEVLNTSGRDICFLTSTCAGYQDALLFKEDQLEMLKMYCNISRPVIKKIEPGKTYQFNVLFNKKSALSKLELGFEMSIVDNSLYDKTLDWDSYKNIESKKVVLWNTIKLTNSN